MCLASAGVLSGSLKNSNSHLHAYFEKRIEDCLTRLIYSSQLARNIPKLASFRSYAEALDFWVEHAEKYQTVAGIHLLLETALRRVDEAPIICKDRIGKQKS